MSYHPAATASRRSPLIFWYLGRPASLYIEAMSKRAEPRRQPTSPIGATPKPGLRW